MVGSRLNHERKAQRDSIDHRGGLLCTGNRGMKY
jgi:hypothetical protein